MNRLPIEPVPLPTLGSRHDLLWTVLCDLSDAHDDSWTIIGGQMVMLHALQAERQPSRVSEDLDTVIDTRVRPPALAAFLATLARLGFASAGVSPDDVAHRFVRDSVHIDVLGPDGLGERTDLRTVGAATTIETRGGTQALERSELLPVRHGNRIAYVPRPNLLGAIIVKAAAVNNDPKPKRHLRDVAFLCSLIDQPLALRDAMTRKDRQRIQAVKPLKKPDHEAWRLLDDPELAYIAFNLLTSVGSP
jgi:hypothetical protein